MHADAPYCIPPGNLARVLSSNFCAAAKRHLQLRTCQPKAGAELPSSKTGVTFQYSVQPSLEAN